MAAIGKIRQHYGILVIIIGLAPLAFVLGDLMKSTGSRRATDLAVVNGEKISYQDFDAKVSQVINYQKSVRGTLTRDDEFSIRTSVLNEMIQDIIMNEEYKKLGLTVSDDELMDMITGDNPHTYITRNFVDANGQFDRAQLLEVLGNFYNMPTEFQEWWLNIENLISEERLNQKYQSLLAHSFYLPKKLADRYNENKKKIYAIKGLKDFLVIDTEDALLICPREDKQFKDFISGLGMPGYEDFR